jgi:hypothetical protein
MILERLKRSDTDGLPKLNYSTPEKYFKTIEKENSHPTWVCHIIILRNRGRNRRDILRMHFYIE